jgi:glycosyltransferase involved in cell wall biosynthesis
MAELKTKRYRSDFWGSVQFLLAIVVETFLHLPRLAALRARARKRTDFGHLGILLVGDNMDSTHGISVSSERMAGQFREIGHQAWLMGVSHSAKKPGTRNPEGSVVMLAPACTVDLHGYEGQELAYPSLAEVCEFFAHNRVDLIEIESPGSFGLLALVLARLLGIPVVHNYRTDLLAYTRILLDHPLFIAGLHWFIRNFLKSGGGNVIVPSRAFVEECASMGIPRSRVVHLPRGVDLSKFSPARRQAGVWSAYGAPEGPVIAYLGRVSREKGLEVLSDAFERVLVEHPDAVLGVIGDGPWRPTFQERLSHTGRAIFTGEIKGVALAQALASADVFAFPSTTDTFGNAVLEAMACGVPAVVTDQGGPKEIVQHDVSGLVVAGGDAVALADTLSGLLADPLERERLGRGALARAEDFRPEVARDSHLSFYQKVVAAPLFGGK